MMPVAFRTLALSRDFRSKEPGGGTIRALDELTLEVPAGAVFGFLGPNGAGKTTTIRLLLGLLEPTSGSAEVLGYSARTQGAEIRQRTGALLEHHGLYERLTAYDNLEFYARIWRLSAQQRAGRIRELLDQFGLWQRRHDAVGTWSRGMKQKLAVARALLHRPQLVFLDEPTTGLDPVAAAALRADLAALAAREGTSIFLTTHNLSEAERLCTYIGVVARGRLLAFGHPDDLRARMGGAQIEILGRKLETAFDGVRALPQVSSVRTENGRLHVTLRNGGSAAPVVSTLVHAGAEIEEVRRASATLEQVFLSLLKADQDA